MKKYTLILAVALLAVPAFAATVTVVPTGPGTADIMYDNQGEAVAAYAIDIVLTAGEVNDVSNFHVGVSVAGADGYGIFPANFDRFITVNGQGDVDDWGVAGYTPVADVNDKGAVQANGITIELGALYKGDANKPANTGTLCSIQVTEGCTATPVLNTIRGGIVLANAGAPASVTLVEGIIPPIGPADLFPSDHPSYNDWVSFGKPECWTYTTHCLGDADGKKQGSAKTGYARVSTDDLNILISAWGVKEAPAGPGILSVDGAICADFDYLAQGSSKTGYSRVSTDDLNILIAAWGVKDPGLVIEGCPGTLEPGDL